MRALARTLTGAAAVLLLVFVSGISIAQAATTPPKVTFSVSIRYTPALRDDRENARYSGTVSHVATSTPVQVQRRTTSGVWRTVATTKTLSTGSFAGTFSPTGLGLTAFRAYVPAAQKRPAVESPQRTATVYEFFPLDKIPLTRETDGVSFDPVSIGDEDPFPHAFTMDGAAVKTGSVQAVWTIGTHCTKVVSYVGIPESEKGLVAEVAVGDGTTKDLFSLSTVTDGGFALIQTPLTGTTRLGLSTSIQTVGTGGQKVDWIAASVLCSVDPRSL